MPVKHASVTAAHALQAEGAVYIDVRSTQEFGLGHPAGAVNVPLLEPDPDTGQIAPNPDFVRVIQANFTPDTKLLIGCQMGGRSMRAAQMLDAFGFTDVTNVLGGFGGARGADRGWAESGLPVDSEHPAGRAYKDLAAKADAGR
jgi:rhodanese-related sulfurtransferase